MKLIIFTTSYINQFLEWIYKPFQRFFPFETFKYGATGGLNTVLDIFLYFITYNFVLDKQIVNLGFIAVSPHIAAFFMVFPVTFSTGFLLAKFVTFTQSEMRGRTQLIRYIITVSGSIILNYVLLKLFVDVLSFYPTISKIFITVIVVIYSYLSQRHFTFKTA